MQPGFDEGNLDRQVVGKAGQRGLGQRRTPVGPTMPFLGGMEAIAQCGAVMADLDAQRGVV